MSVTDHAELLGEVNICESPELDGYSNLVCLVTDISQNLPIFT